MKIKKINQNLELDVTIKKVRLPSLNERIENRDECGYIDVHSLSYGSGRLYHAFFKEFIKDEEMPDDEHYPIYGMEFDCGGVVDLIPIIEIEEKLETGSIYITNNVPFIAATENKLVCLTRTNYYLINETGEIDLDFACDFLDEELNRIYKW